MFKQMLLKILVLTSALPSPIFAAHPRGAHAGLEAQYRPDPSSQTINLKEVSPTELVLLDSNGSEVCKVDVEPSNKKSGVLSGAKKCDNGGLALIQGLVDQHQREVQTAALPFALAAGLICIGSAALGSLAFETLFKSPAFAPGFGEVYMSGLISGGGSGALAGGLTPIIVNLSEITRYGVSLNGGMGRIPLIFLAESAAAGVAIGGLLGAVCGIAGAASNHYLGLRLKLGN